MLLIRRHDQEEFWGLALDLPHWTFESDQLLGLLTVKYLNADYKFRDHENDHWVGP